MQYNRNANFINFARQIPFSTSANDDNQRFLLLLLYPRHKYYASLLYYRNEAGVSYGSMKLTKCVHHKKQQKCKTKIHWSCIS